MIFETYDGRRYDENDNAITLKFDIPEKYVEEWIELNALDYLGADDFQRNYLWDNAEYLYKWGKACGYIRKVWRETQPRYKVRLRIDCLVECEVGADCVGAAKDEVIERLIGAALKHDYDINILDICDADYEEVK